MAQDNLTAAWRALKARSTEARTATLRALRDADPARATRYSREAAGLYLDFSRQRVDDDDLRLLASLADAAGLRARIEAMWRGDPINTTEGRAVLHTALRVPGVAADGPGGADIAREVLAERERMLAFADDVRSGAVRGSGGASFTTVINIGIGGSDLGPAMAIEALHPLTHDAPRVRCVSNVDGTDLANALEGADPARTLFIVASKTFSTQETLANARSARQWLAAKLGEAAVPAHFAAVSTNAQAMDAFGVNPNYRFMMWDWVGGRYSLWSSIGVSIAIAIGRAGFMELLAGAHEMDEHFRSTPWERNLPALMGLLGVWNINFLELPTLAVLPYDGRLKRFPAYLQQLEMESNGKSVSLAGQPLAHSTAPIVWGEAGNNSQHSFFQMLHQGTLRAALDLLLPARSSADNPAQAELAIGNCLAQAEAFAFGYSLEQATTELAARRLPPERVELLARHKVHAGNRPVSVVAFERLDAKTLGRLVALYEHKVFTQGVVWGINSFDQWGVELGKKMCEEVLPLVKDPDAADGTGAMLKPLLKRLQSWKR
ncbi:MAG TPA: glucose-6-phosphate isomerase [Steroidobacteraceae bacterium]|nr:glucose-6-phosphate isomerase [Steroidobacteraceae bacterium]